MPRKAAEEIKMASGGTRGNAGRTPDPEAARRERASDGEWTILPMRREGPVPDWPLTEATPRELDLWTGEWIRPQATAWERDGQQIEVALYVRRLSETELPDSAVGLGTLVKQMQENLGLSRPGLLRYRWKIATDEVAEKTTRTASRKSSRERMTVVRDGTEG